MSASLVGSEMCIRDRSDAMHNHGPEQLHARRILWPEHALVCARAFENAVSYTHLTLPTICSV
eukprot:457585-Alexandrium_andersonii.AAC.1